jgi:hypothetical protein
MEKSGIELISHLFAIKDEINHSADFQVSSL